MCAIVREKETVGWSARCGFAECVGSLGMGLDEGLIKGGVRSQCQLLNCCWTV